MSATHDMRRGSETTTWATGADAVAPTPPGSPRARARDVRELVGRLSEIGDRMRPEPVFLGTAGGRARAINPEYLDLLLEQARVIAALRRLRRRR